MKDKKTKALAREMAIMVSDPEVQKNVKRVARKLKAFKIMKNGDIVNILTRA